MDSGSVFFICGVSGCGKSTIGQLLAEKLNIEFIDGDDFHPKANVDKMASGIPLTDEDRVGWLEAIHSYVSQKKHSLVVACSALKEKYRTVLRGELDTPMHWIFLTGSYELILSRIKARKGHFMPEDLLQSQFDILEVANYAHQIDINNTKEDIVQQIIQKTKMKNQLGLIGLGVMGKSLSRNFASHGL